MPGLQDGDIFMNKSTLNFIIEALMFLILMGQVGMGLSLRLKMHLFGDIHYYIGLILFVLIIVHIYLHRNMVVKMYQKLIVGSVKRKIMAIIYVLVSLTLLVGFVVKIVLKRLVLVYLRRNRLCTF